MVSREPAPALLLAAARRRRIARLAEQIQRNRYVVDDELLASRLIAAAHRSAPEGETQMLPVAVAPTNTPANAPAMRGGAQGPKVLLVDDDPAVLRALGRALRRLGYDVTAVETGAAAAEAFAHGTFDVVISDVYMLDMSGPALLRRIRAEDAEVPVTLLTGAPSVDTAIEAVELQAFRYLTKPVDTQALHEVIASAIRARRSPRPEGDAGEPNERALGVCLTRALDALWIATQPLVDARSRDVFAYEALMRTSEPTLPHPGAILDAAERLDRLPDVNRAVLSRAAEALRGGPSSLTLFVNLHPKDLLDDRLLDAGSPLASLAEQVVFELTERDSLDAVERLDERVEALRARGFRIAIDDLGAGYASLKALVDLKPEFVKIDMGLVRGIDTSSTRRRIVRSLAEMCHGLGVTVVAEGVETPDERDALVELGCDLLQGYWFARPGAGFPEGRWDGVRS